MIIKKLLIWIVILALLRAAWEFPMKDELECGLPDGSKFVLTSTYNYSLIAAHLMPHAQSVSERTDYRISYYDGEGRRLDLAPAGVGYSYGEKCSYVGMIQGTPIVEGSYRKKEGGWFDTELTPYALYLSGTPSEQPEKIRIQLKHLGLSPEALLDGNILPIGKTLVNEQGLVTYKDEYGNTLPDGKIVAVYQSTSNDDGKTWSEPIITKDVKIYELGKSTYEQSFIARPISINGKKIEAHFPLPQ